MASGPTTTNGTATVVNTVINDAFSAGETIVTNSIVAEIAVWTGPMAPVTAWLVNTFLKPLIGPIVSYVGGKLSIVVQTVGTFTVIDIQTSSESNSISQALAAVLAAKKSGDANALAEALKDYQSAQSALANSDGSATPST